MKFEDVNLSGAVNICEYFLSTVLFCSIGRVLGDKSIPILLVQSCIICLSVPSKRQLNMMSYLRIMTNILRDLGSYLLMGAP